MRIFWASVSLLSLPINLIADTAPITNIEAPWVKMFFEGAELAAGHALSQAEKNQYSQFSSFVAESQKAADLGSKWDRIFSKYIKDTQKFVHENGNMKVQFADNVPAFYQAREMRRLFLKVKKMKSADKPKSEAEVFIFASQAMKDDANRTFGAGTSAKLALDADYSLGLHNRTFVTEKPWVKSERHYSRDDKGRLDPKFILHFADGEKQEVSLPEEWKEANKANGDFVFSFDDSAHSYNVPNYPLLSKDVGANRAIFVDDRGVYLFVPDSAKIPANTSKAFVDSAEAAYEVFMKTSPKKQSMLSSPMDFDGTVPGLTPKVCSPIST